MVQKSMVGKSRVENFMVKKSLVERSGVEDLGWKVHGLDLLQPFGSVESPTNNIIRSERQVRLSFYDKLSTFGGILGLCNGMSALSIAECLFLLCSLFYALLRIVGKRLNFICITEKSDTTDSAALENDTDQSDDENDEDLWLQLVDFHVSLIFIIVVHLLGTLVCPKFTVVWSSYTD